MQGACLVPSAVSAAADLHLHATLAPLDHLVVHQVACALIRRVVQNLGYTE